MDITYKLLVDNIPVEAIDFPSMGINSVFNTIDFSLSSKAVYTEGFISKLKGGEYLTCTYRINSDNYYFIIDSYDESLSFGVDDISFSGLSKTALVEERFSGYTKSEGTISVFQALQFVQNKMSPYGVSTPAPFNVSGEVETEGRSALDILQDVENLCELTLVSTSQGDVLKFIGGVYNSSDVVDVDQEVVSIESFVKASTSFEIDANYDKVTIVSGEDDSDFGELIIETEKITDSSYYLRVYTEPLLDTFGSVSVRLSDGSLETVALQEIKSEQELLDFTEDSAQLQYPIYDVLETIFYNKSNSLVYNRGYRDISLSTSDDLACAKISYRTMRNVYIISNLTEPMMKLAVEVN